MPLRKVPEYTIQAGTKPSLGYANRYPEVDMPTSVLTAQRANQNITGSPPGGIKDAYLSQYKDIASQNLGSSNRQNLSYTDSPVFQKGLEKWDPTSIGSKVIQNWSIPVSRGIAYLGDKTGLWESGVPEGAAQWLGTQTSAGFRKDIQDKIKSGTATPEEKQKFANVFGHEMSHLGWDYKPASERITIGDSLENLKSEGSGIEALAKAVSGDYGGEEQWNFMHDLMYGGPYTRRGEVDVKKNIEDLKQTYQSLPKGSPERKEAFKETLKKMSTDPNLKTSRVYDYLTKRELINPGDLSYTPKAYDEIAWSGLTTPSKRAIGFGINPFEDTRAAGQFYRRQKYRKMSQAKKQAAMQKTIRQAEAAKKKVIAQKKITTGGPTEIKSYDPSIKKTGPTYGPYKKTKVKVKAKHSPHGGGQGGYTPPKKKTVKAKHSPHGGGPGGGGGQKSRGGHKAPGGGGYGPHRGGRNPWGRADGGLIRLFKYGGFLG